MAKDNTLISENPSTQRAGQKGHPPGRRNRLRIRRQRPVRRAGQGEFQLRAAWLNHWG